MALNHRKHSSNRLKLSDVGESGLIRRLRKKVRHTSPRILAGIGDDAAAVDITDRHILATSDMMIEGVHFDLSFTTFYQLGYRFLAVNISDIFAMAGKPLYFMVNIGMPGNFSVSSVQEMYSGIMGLARKYGIAVIGGDSCASKNSLVLSGTLLGSAKKRIITRSGAKAGDNIYINDYPGDSAMGLRLLQKRRKKIRSFTPLSHSLKLMRKHLLPEPAPVKDVSSVTAMIDVSDGLLKDIGHICNESSIGALIYRDKIPLSKELRRAAETLGVDPVEYAFKGGDDYIMLFTAPSDIKSRAHCIGKIIKRGRYIINEKGEKSVFRPEGYEHFSGKGKQ